LVRSPSSRALTTDLRTSVGGGSGTRT
jgi:hypothetical protein